MVIKFIKNQCIKNWHGICLIAAISINRIPFMTIWEISEKADYMRSAISSYRSSGTFTATL
jgi:formate hydrogenlyase regulatory protein HycA